jgi:DNA polymerase III subunit alpha
MTATQVNLHNHTQGSMLDGLQTVKQAARRAREVGSDALSITDHNEVNQHFAFQKACQAEGIHHVLGIEADWVYDVQWTRDNFSYPTNRSHICLLAGTDEGLANIWKLATLAYTEKYRYNKPLITPDLMREHSAGVWASDGCALTEMTRAIEKGDEDLARQHFAMLQNIYGDHFYSELHTFQFINPAPTDELTWFGDRIPVTRANEIMRDLNQAKIRFANEMSVPLVVVNDSHHSRPEDWVNKDLVWKFSTHKKTTGDDQQVEATLQKADHLMGGEEIYGWMAMHGIGREVVDQCIANSYAIAHSCQATVRKTLDMPSLTGSAADDLRMLIAKTQAGFEAKVTKEGLPEELYFRRVEEELSLIASKGFPGYFLVVDDEVEAAVSGRWAPYTKLNAPLEPVLVGPGRGSAGGSLVAYLVGITSIDPIHYDLLFERFLAPGRKGLPDIDVDFPQSQRPGEKEYLSARYGHDHVCSIGTLSHSQPKGLLQDLARAMGVWAKAPADVIAMSKIVEQVKGIETEESAEGGEAATWDQVVQAKGGDLARWAKKYPELFAKINEFYSMTDGDGPIRSSGIHASGVVVANQPLLGFIPLRSRPKDGETVTQFDMFEVEEMGAVKLDILGIRHLDTLMQARNMIYDRHGVWLDFRRDHLPQELRGAVGTQHPVDAMVIGFGYDHYADPEIWPQVANGGTAGFFQVESSLLTKAAADLKPQNERDVAALISIVRPGVKDAGLDRAYLQRRAGIAEVVYDHPMMEPITSETYGVLIYQEQLLRSVRDLAHFSPDEASDLQKALSKKWMDKVVAFKEKFVEGCMHHRAFMDEYVLNSEHDYDEAKAQQVALKIWASIEASGRYAFNKSHAVGYAIISTWEIWTKHYYPIEFIAALMATDSENINVYIREARRRGIAILPPHVNDSNRKFTLTDTVIRYGLDTLHGLGEAGVTELLAKRPFTGLEDLVTRCDAKKGVGKTQVEALIKIGAMEGWGTRHDLFVEYQDLQIWRPVAEGVKAKKNTPELRAEHIAAWRARHAGEGKYEREFGAASVPNFADEAVIHAIEQELVGNFVTNDPMEKYNAAIAQVAIAHPSQIQGFDNGEEFVIGGQVTGLRVIQIKKEGRNKGRNMAFLSVDFNEETFEITLFPESYEQNKAALVEGAPVACAVIRDSKGCNLKYVQRLDALVQQQAS